MLHYATRVIQSSPPSPATVLTAVALLAIALCCGAQSARATDAAPKPATDATVKVTAFPPSIRVDAKSGASKDEDESTDPANPTKRAPAHIRIDTNDDFPTDEFQATIEKMPWIIGLIFLVVGSIFLTPVVLLIGIIWYKLRKTRLQNEAVLKLAERGAMAPAQAADAVMSGVTPEGAMASTVAPLVGASAAPVYQQAVVARRRAVWSDFRKGVILTAIGLSFVFYWMVESGSASWLGLVLMFLGLGYLLLWWFEDRHLERRETGADVGVDVGKK
jgi:hypothetical protein